MFLQGLSATNGPIMHSDGVQTRPLQATDAQWLDSTVNRDHLRGIEDGFTGELMGLGRRPILTAFDMNIGIGNYSSTLDMARNEAADAQWEQTQFFLTAPIALPATLSAGLWLATSPVAVGGLAWLDFNQAAMDGPYIPGPLTVSGNVVPNRLATEADEAMFWSGVGRGGDAVAANVAAQQGRVTLETTLAARGIELPPWDPTNPAAVTAWRQASYEYAAGASGHVRVLQGDAVRVDSVWAQVEFPALKTNPNVQSITVIDARTGTEVLLWSR